MPSRAAIEGWIYSVNQMQETASDGVQRAFGLDMQNLRAELQTAEDGLVGLFAAQQGAGILVTNALNAALQIITSLTDQLSQGVSARIAAYNAIPIQSIGGYDELETFLNNVRVILDLPTITPASASTDSKAVDYESSFDSIALNLKGAQDYLDGLVRTIVEGGASPAPTGTVFQGSIISALGAVSAAANSLKSNATPQFMQLYGNLVNDIASSLNSAVNTYGAVTFGGLNATDFNEVTSNLKSVLTSVSTNLDTLRSGYNQTGSSGDDTNSPTSAATDVDFPELETLFYELSNMLKERYSFDVFAPASINYGLLLNYRQRWAPQSYQVGNLAATIPLAPGETRKYTTKKVVKKSRNRKALDDSLHTDKQDSSQTQRDDAEIFADASQKTAFGANASGSFQDRRLRCPCRYPSQSESGGHLQEHQARHARVCDEIRAGVSRSAPHRNRGSHQHRR